MNISDTTVKYLSNYFFEKSEEDGIGNYWLYLKNSNLSFTFCQIQEIFLKSLEFICEQGLADFFGAYDKGEIKWEGDIERFIAELKKFVITHKKEIIKTDSFFYNFKYCFIKWKVDSQGIDWGQFDKSN